jgi:hypothetical protein
MLARTARNLVPAILLAACGAETPDEPVVSTAQTVEPRPEIYAEFELTTDLSHLSDKQREMIGVLIEASNIMDDLYWRQAFNDGYADWLESVEDDRVRRSSMQPIFRARKACIHWCGAMMPASLR